MKLRYTTYNVAPMSRTSNKWNSITTDIKVNASLLRFVHNGVLSVTFSQQSEENFDQEIDQYKMFISCTKLIVILSKWHIPYKNISNYKLNCK